MAKRKKKTIENDNPILGGTHPFFYHTLISNLTPDLNHKVILDAGCGRGINGYLIRASRNLKGSKLIGIEINDTYLNLCKKHKIYDKLIKHRLPTVPLKDKSVDFLICLEVIEHLTKKDGLKLLDELERVSRGRIIVTTPNLFFHADGLEHEDDHHSLWSIQDFKKRGYKIIGMGLKTPLMLDDPFLKIKQALYFFMTPFSYFFPSIGAYIIAVKDF